MPITLGPGEERHLDVALTPLTARLWGYITDAVTSVPIASAAVQLTGPYLYSTITNADGYYEIVGIIPGVYNGQVSAEGYEGLTF